MKKKLFAIVVALAAEVSARAENLSLAHIFSDHAVLQRESTVPVWGWGEPGKTVSVKDSWSGKSVKTKIGDDGSWKLWIKTGEAGGPYTLTVKSGKEKLVIQDICLGEVWVCSGQSNMEMPVGGFGFQEVEGGTETILESFETAGGIRVFKINTPKRETPDKDVENVWELSAPVVTANTSAVAYFFAKRLHKSLGVPVGIIVNAWGGSRIEPWMTKDVIRSAGLSGEELEQIDALRETAPWPQIPEVIWNGRVAPVAGYGAKGFLWYQGCSNIGQNCYDKLQTAMVKFWREQWGRGDMPFIYALLAPYEHGDANGRWRPHFVETQMRALKTTPASWAVSLETLGDKVTIHPSKKKEVADMMFLTALQNVYGQWGGITAAYPEPKSIDFLEDGRVKIQFTNVWSNLMSIVARDVVGFELAGEDRTFFLADAQVDWDGETVYVSCGDVPRPVAVRYAFRNYMGANLQTSFGIPVPPFRSDDWEY